MQALKTNRAKQRKAEHVMESEASSHHIFLKEWEHIQSPPISLLQSHIRWEILDNPRNDFSVFPPSNHEGLHISPPQHHQQTHDVLGDCNGDTTDDVDVNEGFAIKDEDEEHPDAPRLISSSPSLVSIWDFGFQMLRDVLMERLRLGFGVLRSKLFWVASLVRVRFGANWGVIASALIWSSLWHLWCWWRWRRRLKRERSDRLILLLQGQNEKISQLSEQITRLNEILLSRRRVPILGSS